MEDRPAPDPIDAVTLDEWPACPILNCDSKAFLAIQSPLCFSHTRDYLVKKIGDRRVNSDIVHRILKEILGLQHGLL